MYTQTIKRIGFALFAAFVLAISSLMSVAQAEEEFIPISHFETPYEDSIVSGLVQIEVFMHDSKGQGVEFTVDGQAWQKMDYKGNGRYSTLWNTSQVLVGQHTLSARFNSPDSERQYEQPKVSVMVIHELPPAPNKNAWR